MPGLPILVLGFACITSPVNLAAQESPKHASRPAPSQAIEFPKAAQWLSNSRQTLMNTPSLRARIEQRGQMATLPFVSRGIYEAGRFPFVRLEMHIQLGTLEGRLTEVCDGQVLWTAREVRGLPIKDVSETEREESLLPPGTELLVSRRDIDLISEALAGSEQTVEQVLAAELGVGGLPSLLAGLEWAFDYQTESQDDGRLVFKGRWKPAVREKLGVAEGKRVPSEVEVVARPDIPVPEQITYYGLADEKRTPILQMRFSDVAFGQDTSSDRFRYVPPSGVEVTNLTPGVISEIKMAEEPAEAQ